MPARKRAREMHELLQAVVNLLPAQGVPFPAGARAAWLKMVATAFDVAYGVTEEVIPPFTLDGAAEAGRKLNRLSQAALVAASSVPPRPKHAAYKFHIDEGGNALNAEGVPVMRDDIPAETEIFDYRPVAPDSFRDVEGIMWADGQKGTIGIAAGVSFCGPG